MIVGIFIASLSALVAEIARSFRPEKPSDRPHMKIGRRDPAE